MVICWGSRRKELIQVLPGILPSLAVAGDGKLGPVTLDLKSASHENVRTADGPDNGSQLALLGGKAGRTRLDRLHRVGARPPGFSGEVRAVLPQTVAERVRVQELVAAVTLHRVQVPPAPRNRLVGAEDHVHGGIALAVAVPADLAFKDIVSRLQLVFGPVVGQKDALRMRPLDEVMVSGDIPIVGNGFVVAEEVKDVLVAVQQVPAAIEECLRDAVPQGPRCATLWKPALCHSPARQMESFPQVLWP